MVIVIADRYMDKKVLNLGLDTWIKGRNELPVQLKLSITLIELVELHATTELIKTWVMVIIKSLALD